MITFLKMLKNEKLTLSLGASLTDLGNFAKFFQRGVAHKAKCNGG
jgi:hypothetical protein